MKNFLTKNDELSEDPQQLKLLQRLKDGDSIAARQWFGEYHDRLLQFVQQKISIESDAEEVVQETFINCLRQIALFRGDSSLWTWMCSIARHEVADYYRKKYAKKTLQLLPLYDSLFDVAAANQITASAQQEQTSQVRKVLQKLPPVEQEILELKYVDNQSVAEISQQIGKTVKAVESLLFRARQLFRQERQLVATEFEI